MARILVTVAALVALAPATAQQLTLTYPGEIFDYCVDRHDGERKASTKCMKSEEKRRIRLMRDLRKTAGGDASTIYAACARIFPDSGIRPIATCAKAQADAAKISGSTRVANAAYVRCLRKWERADAAGRCAKRDARHYKKKGTLPKK